jgi:CoA-transferase family III
LNVAEWRRVGGLVKAITGGGFDASQTRIRAYCGDRSGYDVTTGAEWGIFNLEGTDALPDTSEVSIVNDYVTGWLCTIGVLEALRRRSIEGGSWRVQTSLTRVSLWLLSLGIFDKDYMTRTKGSTDEHKFVDPDLFTAETPMGSYQGLGEQVYMMRTPGRFHTVVTPKGSAKAAWL